MKTIIFEIMYARRLAIFISGLTLCFLSGCGTIQFVQHEQTGEQATVHRWHHSTLNGMVEISKPLNIESICGQKAWTTITTERTFYNLVVNFLAPQVFVFNVYNAWTNKVQCYEVDKTEENLSVIMQNNISAGTGLKK